MPVPFTIVIISHGRPDLLKRTLESLEQCEFPATFSGTLVIENGKRCGNEAVVLAASAALRATYQFVEAPVKSASLNHAARQYPGQWLVFFDDDVRLSPDVLNTYVAAFERHPHESYFGGWTEVDSEQSFPRWLEPYLPASAKGFSPVNVTRLSPTSTEDASAEDSTVSVPCQHFLGFNWSAKADALLKCGGFDERLGPGTPFLIGDEGLMQLRLHLHGLQGHYLPNARVWHYVPASRLTPEFAIRRAYPGGFMRAIRTGLDCDHFGNRRPSLWSEIRRVFRKLTWPTLKRAPWALPFALRFQWLYARGFIQGTTALNERQWTTLPNSDSTHRVQ